MNFHFGHYCNSKYFDEPLDNLSNRKLDTVVDPEHHLEEGGLLKMRLVSFVFLCSNTQKLYKISLFGGWSKGEKFKNLQNE